MDSKRKVTILKGTTSEEKTQKNSADPQPGTSSGVFKVPKPPKAHRKHTLGGAEGEITLDGLTCGNFAFVSVDPVVKRMRLERNIRKVTPEDLEFPEGIVLKTPGDDSQTKSILCTTPPVRDDDVLIIDLSDEEIAEILGGNTVDEESSSSGRRRIKRYLKNFASTEGDNKLGKIFFEKKEKGRKHGEDEKLEEEIPEILKKTPDDDPTLFDVIDLTTDDDLEEDRENLHMQLTDKYVEERSAPDLKDTTAKPSKPSDTQDDNPSDPQDNKPSKHAKKKDCDN